MSGSFYSIEADEFDSLVQKMEAYGPEAVTAINQALSESGPDIYQHVNQLIHPSGRRFKGHSSSATASDWSRYTPGQLSITVGTKSKFNYLYFPDDGSDTRRHAGMQNFFERGGEAAADKVIERCEEALIRGWED